jgi:hypothetical protein|tara:strand:+ start:281 stop:847 length:567 start_codon:yes stop_codon:yes gene_type:complete
MSRFKNAGNLAKVILGLFILFVVWSLWTNIDFSNNVDGTAVSKNMLLQTDEKAPISNVQNDMAMSNIKKINNSTDMLALTVGANFSLRTEFNGESDITLLRVFDVAKNAKFTQIQGKGLNGDVAVITLTPTLTNMLLKTSTNIFEYTGDDFQGILNQVASLNLSDDIHTRKSKAQPTIEDIKPKTISE